MRNLSISALIFTYRTSGERRKNMNLTQQNSAAFTGYRTTKLPFAPTEENVSKLKYKLTEAINAVYEKGVRYFYSGMCQGVDIWAAEAVLEFKKTHPDVEIICAIPFEGHADSLKGKALEEYENIVKKSFRADCLKGRISYREMARAFNERNNYMVSNSDFLIAVCNERSISPGGTANTVKMAQKKNMKIIFVDPSEI